MAVQRDWHFDSNIEEVDLEQILNSNHESWEILPVDLGWLSSHVNDREKFYQDEECPQSGLILHLLSEHKILLYSTESDYIVQKVIEYYRSKEPVDQSDPLGKQADPECPSSPLVGFL
jgi:hypothetical protein